MRISRKISWLPHLVLAAGSLAVSGAASAACTATIESVGTSPLVQYFPYDGNVATAQLTVRLLVDDGGTPGTCQLGLAAFDASPGSARYMSNGSDQLLYRLFTTAGGELINGAEGIVALPLDGSGSHQNIPLRIEVPASQFSPAGDYSELLTLRLFDMSGAPAMLGADATAEVRTAIEARAEVNIAGATNAAGGQFAYDRLDFGALSTGENSQCVASDPLDGAGEHKGHITE